MATFTELDEAAILAVASDFGIGTPTQWTSIAAGTINSNYQIATEHGRFFLRVNEGQSLAQVRYEIALLKHWSTNAVAAPLPLAGPGGERFLRHEGHYLSLFPWLPGGHVGSRCIRAAHCKAVGHQLARLHLAGRRAEPSLMQETRYSDSHLRELYASFVDSRDPQLTPAVQIIGDEFEFLEQRAERRQGLERGLIHADLFPDNVLFDGEDVVSLLDFEQACGGVLLYDLAVALNAWCFASTLHADRYRAMVDAYCQTRQIPPPDEETLRIELRAATLRFAITRITDVYLRGEDAATKDFRRFLMRLEHWRSEAIRLAT